MGLGIDARDLYRDVVDVGLLERLYCVVVATVGFLIAKHHLTEQVDVLSDILLVALGQVLSQCRACGVEDDTRGVHAQTFLDDGDGNGIEVITKSLVHLEEQTVAGIEELGHAILVDEHFDALGQLTVVAYL